MRRINATQAGHLGGHPHAASRLRYPLHLVFHTSAAQPALLLFGLNPLHHPLFLAFTTVQLHI